MRTKHLCFPYTLLFSTSEFLSFERTSSNRNVERQDPWCDYKIQERGKWCHWGKVAGLANGESWPWFIICPCTQINRSEEINGFLTYHLGELKMNQHLKGPPSFVLNKNVTFKDKKIVKYRMVFVFLRFHRKFTMLQEISQGWLFSGTYKEEEAP